MFRRAHSEFREHQLIMSPILSSAHVHNQIRKTSFQDQACVSIVQPRRAASQNACLAASRASRSSAFGGSGESLADPMADLCVGLILDRPVDSKSISSDLTLSFFLRFKFPSLSSFEVIHCHKEVHHFAAQPIFVLSVLTVTAEYPFLLLSQSIPLDHLLPLSRLPRNVSIVPVPCR